MFDYRSVMSGQRRDVPATLLRAALRLASIPYAWVVAVRNRRFDLEKSEIHRASVPVISVGNLTTGGTGKTPIVCHLAKLLRRSGLRVAIVSRGYGRGESDENDEAAELHARLPDVPHVQNPDRFAAAEIATEELECEIILMDDGFQHRRLHRDLDLVVIDMTCPFGFDALLPRGLLREPISSLRRADAVILSRCDQASEDQLEHVASIVRQHHQNVPIIRSNHRAQSLLQYPDRVSPMEEIKGERVATLCAIGNPAAFVETVERCGAIVADGKSLPDHDPYAPETVRGLIDWLRGLDVHRVVCTHKDLVKLRTDQLAGLPLSAILIELDVVDADTLEKVALSVIR